MELELDAALERVLNADDEWQSWRSLSLAARMEDESRPGTVPPPHPDQDELGGMRGPLGRASPGTTGEALCHLKVIGLGGSTIARRAAEWLASARTPAMAWLDAPDDVPGDLDTPAAGRVWATAAAACGLLAIGDDPGPRAIDLLRGEADMEGRFTGGAYPTFAAAGAYWLAEGPQTEMAEWALRWARESPEDWWGVEERVSALTFWGAAGIPSEHASVERFLEELLADAESESGWRDLEITLLVLELGSHFGIF
ncbi:MAG TPA: hypothetical protein VHJ82_10925 [Actinomycetota bacterium]|nr:hypothetical protein [Actinomycetota bacterium]